MTVHENQVVGKMSQRLHSCVGESQSPNIGNHVTLSAHGCVSVRRLPEVGNMSVHGCRAEGWPGAHSAKYLIRLRCEQSEHQNTFECLAYPDNQADSYYHKRYHNENQSSWLLVQMSLLQETSTRTANVHPSDNSSLIWIQCSSRTQYDQKSLVYSLHRAPLKSARRRS